ncbi:MAG: glycosyltransferase family 4 protein, partial [candidate division Zixibacteria bacterium]|nr:glycosyltransferase family 4 protein [candidate division Zixibacteria bacterium]
GKKVYFYGRVDVDDIAGYYKSSDLGILLLEPLAENNRLALPNKFFSYIAAGLPIIVSDIPELSNFVSKYQMGIIVDEDAKIADSINNLLQNEGRYNLFRENALKFSREYSWDKEVSKYSEIYDRLLNE